MMHGIDALLRSMGHGYRQTTVRLLRHAPCYTLRP